METAPSSLLFEHVARKDYDGLSRLYAEQARHTVVSFLAMRNRWQGHHNQHNHHGVTHSASRAEEKMDDFLQEIASREAASAASYDEEMMTSSGASAFSSSSGSYYRSSNFFRKGEDPSYTLLLRELADFLTDKIEGEDEEDEHCSTSINCPHKHDEGDKDKLLLLPEQTSTAPGLLRKPKKKKRLEISADAERMLREAAALFTDSRPPSNFVVYEDGSVVTDEHPQPTGGASLPVPEAVATRRSTSSISNASTVSALDGEMDTAVDEGEQPSNSNPPIFDGSVANATPPPLGGDGMTGAASGGAGTILHLACALDEPLALALCLSMGADARACHTAFRRLMIHEAACNGSIQCLKLLLELGRQCRQQDDDSNDADAKLPPRVNRTSAGANHNNTTPFELPFLPRRMDRTDILAPLHMYATQPSFFVRRVLPATVKKDDNRLDFVSLLRLFRELGRKVKREELSELDAARHLLEVATLHEVSKAALARSCAFEPESTMSMHPHLHHRFAPALAPRTLARSSNRSSDGHGNTPLHWAAFKNETGCVSLLLSYGADPNARAHPSGWTPLHDAAYSNSSETIDLLVRAGARVDAQANSGATPLCFAAQEDAFDAAGLLLEFGADLTARCAGGPVRDDGSIPPVGAAHPHSRFSGYTPLHYCAHYNASRAARILLRHSTAPKAMEIPDLNDRLPIHVAVARGSSDVLRELLHAGARVETRMKASTMLDNSDNSGRLSTHSVPGAPGNEVAAATPPQSSFRRGQPPTPEHPTTPRSLRSPRGSSRSSASSGSMTPVSSPVLRSMIPSQPVTSSKPWNCLTQQSIDECRELISQAERHWSPERNALFTPADRKAVWTLLLVGKRLERGSGIYVDLWPQVLTFCGRGWFDPEEADDDEPRDFYSSLAQEIDDIVMGNGSGHGDNNSGLSLPTF